MSEQAQDCPQCEGKGWYTSEKSGEQIAPCPNCDGYGWVSNMSGFREKE